MTSSKFLILCATSAGQILCAQPLSSQLFEAEHSITNNLSRLLSPSSAIDLTNQVALEGLFKSAVLIGRSDGLSRDDLDHALAVKLHLLRELYYASDKHYNIQEEHKKVGVSAPLPTRSGITQILVSGMSPAGIRDPALRAEYEKSIAENQKRKEKLDREVFLSRLFDMLADQTSHYISDYYPGESAHQHALEIIAAELKSEAPREKLVQALDARLKKRNIAPSATQLK